MKNLLLVDDDEDDRDFFLSVLHTIDDAAQCEVAENGAIALRMLATGTYLPGLIFLDLNMPVMDGKQFLIEMRKIKHLENIPVVILSTSSDHATISEAARLGAVDFITKPNKLSLLEERLREIFASSTLRGI